MIKFKLETNWNFQEIVKGFKQSYGKDLVNDIKSETRANFEAILVALCTPLTQFYCQELRTAMVDLGTDEDCLIEVLCSLTNQEINDIKMCYHRMYGSILEQDLVGETSGNFKRLLVSLCNASRDESGRIDANSARVDAQELLKAGVARFGTDESEFNRILCQRNFEQLKLVCQEYQSLAGHSLEKAIKKEFSGDIEDGLLAILDCVNNKHEFFAKRLHKSMAGLGKSFKISELPFVKVRKFGLSLLKLNIIQIFIRIFIKILGTNDAQLIRLVVTRCEIDMVEIKEAFQRKYGKTLKSFIKVSFTYSYGISNKLKLFVHKHLNLKPTNSKNTKQHFGAVYEIFLDIVLS